MMTYLLLFVIFSQFLQVLSIILDAKFVSIFDNDVIVNKTDGTTFTSSGRIHCGQLCAQTVNCTGYNYVQGPTPNGDCEIMTSAFSQSDVISRTGGSVYMRVFESE